MTFKNNGGYGDMSSWLKWPMYFTRKWTPFKPSEHCRITLSGGKYELTCKSADGKGFEVTVSEKEVVRLRTDLTSSKQLPPLK